MTWNAQETCIVKAVACVFIWFSSHQLLFNCYKIH